MPNYQYRCIECHNELNEIRSVTADTSLISCNICNGKLKRIYTPPAITFKGPGFYKNTKK